MISSIFIWQFGIVAWDHPSIQCRNVIYQWGVYVCMHTCVFLCLCVLDPRGREHPGRRGGDWLSCWVLLTRVQFLYYVNTNRPVSHWLDGQHTHAHMQGPIILITVMSVCNRAACTCFSLLPNIIFCFFIFSFFRQRPGNGSSQPEREINLLI